MGYFIYFVLGITLVFIFPGIISFIAVILGFLFNMSVFPIDLLNFYVYPVGVIVYCVVYVLYAYLLYEFIHHHLMVK